MATSDEMYSLPKDWPVDKPDPKVLYVGCKVFTPSPAMQGRLKELLSPFGTIEELKMENRYAVVKFTDIGNRDRAMDFLKDKKKDLEGHPILPGRAWNKLSRGRLETILEHQIKKVVVIPPKNTVFEKKIKKTMTETMESFGPITTQIQIDKKLAYFTYADVYSVINALAADNYNLLNDRIEINPKAVESLKVKPSIIVLVHDIKKLQYTSLQNIHTEEDFENLKLALSAYGNVQSLKKTNLQSGVVTYSSSRDAHNALKADITLNSEMKISLKILGADEKKYGLVLKTNISSTTSTPGEGKLDTSCFYEVPSLYPPVTESYHVTQLPPTASVEPSAEPSLSLPQTFSVFVPPPSFTIPPPPLPMAAPVQLPNQVPPPSLSIPPPPLPMAAPVQLPNQVEIICTTPACLEYCKQVRNALRCLGLRVGVLNPAGTIDLNQIIISMKNSGVTAAVFIDDANLRENTVSAKLLEDSSVMMKDVQLGTAINEIARLVNSSSHHQGFIEPPEPENPRFSDKGFIPPQPSIQGIDRSTPPAYLRDKQEQYSQPEDSKRRDMKYLCRSILKGQQLSIKENSELINYFVEERSRAVHDEYKGYVPRGVRHPAVGPYGDPELKILREKYKSALEELIMRNLPEHSDKDENTEVKTDSKNKIESALKTLLSLDSTQLKSIAGANVS